MIIGNLNNFYSFDFYPNIFAIFICWDRVFKGLKDKPVRLIQIAGPLAFAVAFQFVVIAWQIPDIL